MTIFSPQPCPCQSGLDYAHCCQPYHQGIAAPTADVLMRSRYSAFVLRLIDYIIATTLPAQQSALDKTALQQWSSETAWDGLEVISLPDNNRTLDKQHAQVEFKAYFKQGLAQDFGRDFHHELSTFVLVNQRWYFLDPTVECNLSLKQPCLCGSGKKFKHCCAAYL